MEEQAEYQFKVELFQNQELYMKEIPCQRRNVRKKQQKVTKNQVLYLTNYRLIFVGPTHEVFPMEIFIRDIQSINKHQKPQKKMWLFQINRKLRNDKVSSAQKKDDVQFLGFDSDKKYSVQQLEKYINTLIKNQDTSEVQLKKQLLMTDKVRYSVYNNLVNKLKLITEEQFWERHKFIVENRIDQRLQYQKFQVEKKPQLVGTKIQHQGRPKQVLADQRDFQGYSIRKQIQNMSLKGKSQQLNQETRDKIIKEIEDMYLRDSTAYHHLKITEPQQLANQGIYIVKTGRPMQIEQSKDSVPNIKSGPVKISVVEDVKFRIKPDEVEKQILSSKTGIVHKKKMQSNRQDIKQKQKQDRLNLTKKTVQYVSIFYMLMQRKQEIANEEGNRDKIGEMQKQIQSLRSEITNQGGANRNRELLVFVQKSLSNYNNHRKGEFFVQ